MDTGEEYEFHWCGTKKRREAGVGILVKVDKQIQITDPDYQDPRIMAFDLLMYGFSLRVVNVYAPTETGGTKSEKDNFYRKMNKACLMKNKKQKLLVLGDLNATTSIAYKKSCFDGIKVLPDDSFNDNGSRLKSFCRQNKLGMASTFFDCTSEERITWYSCDKKTAKKNDFVLPESFIQQYITMCKAYPNIEFDSDHRIIITNIATPMTKKARWKRRPTISKSKTDPMSLRETDVKTRFLDGVKIEFTNGHNPAELKSSDDTSMHIIETLKKVGAENLLNKNAKKTVNEIWRNDKEFNELLEQRKRIKSGTDQHKIITKRIKKKVNFLKNKKLEEEAFEINEHSCRRDIENLYRCMKASGDTFGDVKRKKCCDPNKLKNHFEKHFNPRHSTAAPAELETAPNFIKLLQSIPENIHKTAPPDREELYKTIMKLKSGKSAIDVPAIYIKTAIEYASFLDEMTKLYQTIWETNVIPKEWGHSKLVAIWKGSSKGPIENPEAYRALQIGSSLCKILVIVIINRIKDWYDKQLMDQQVGFRSGRGTTDGLYRIKRAQQIAKRRKKRIFAAFIDLSSAFDHVNRTWLFKSIKQRFNTGTDLKLIQLLESLYQNTTTALAETPGDKFVTGTGVRQGGPESPLLYNLFMDYVMRTYLEECSNNNIEFVSHKYRIPIYASRNNYETVGMNLIDWIGYADDIVLCLESKALLQKSICLLNETFKRFGLKINVTKTKTMIINNDAVTDEYPSSICNMEEKEIDNVKVFRYLGGNIKYDEHSTGDEEIELRLESGEAKFYELVKKLLNHKIVLKTRVQILNSLVRSRLTYACQCWPLTIKQKQLLCSKYNLMLRKMVKGGFKRKDDSMSFKLTNDDLLKLCKTESLDKFIERQQKKYLAHVIRMENSSITKKLLYDDSPSQIPGPELTLTSNVLRAEKMSAINFAKNALEKIF